MQRTENINADEAERFRLLGTSVDRRDIDYRFLWPAGAMSTLYIMCMQDVGASVGSSAACITCRKHGTSDTFADKASSDLYFMTCSREQVM
jgi:hypothetical protein